MNSNLSLCQGETYTLVKLFLILKETNKINNYYGSHKGKIPNKHFTF